MILFDTLNHVILPSLPGPHIVLSLDCGILLFPIEDSRIDNNSINWIRIEKISSNFFSQQIIERIMEQEIFEI